MRAMTTRSISARASAGGALLAALLATASLACGGAADAGERRRAARGEGEAAPAAWGPGFVVWESNRTGAFRIFRRDLAGGAAVQLSSDEPGRDHCCAHVSPDGQRIAYLSIPGGGRKYLPADTRGQLRLMLADGSLDRVVGPAARHYGEHRAAIWWSRDELVYLEGDGATVRLDLSTGKRERLLAPTGGGEGRLVDPTGRWATGGTVAFCRIDEATGRVLDATPLGGCQPYFDPAGRLGYWAAGAGGPIDAIDLETGRSRTLIAKRDPRLPSDRGYVYFPMLSPDGSLLALAGSDGEHDHFRADYDVLLLEVDPATLEPLGPAVRISDHPAVDRFPAPFRVEPPRRRARPPVRTTATVPAEPGWPAVRDGLAFAWEQATAPNRIAPGEASDVLEPRGRAAFDRRGRMSLGGGWFEARAETATRLLAALRDANTMTLTALVEPERPESPGGPIVALSVRPGRRSFVVRQRGDRIELVLRTAESGPAGGEPIPLTRADASRPAHVAFTFSPGRLAVYVDGEPVARRPVAGDFFHWREGALLFGAEAGSDERFRGAISHVAIWARELAEPEVAASAERARAALASAPQPPSAEVEARLVARSRVPTLDEISPYRSALAVEEWEVVEAIAGVPLAGRIRVARWMLLDGRPTPESAEPPGTRRRLRLEPHAAQPQLESVVLSDTLPPAPAGAPPLGFDVGWSGG